MIPNRSILKKLQPEFISNPLLKAWALRSQSGHSSTPRQLKALCSYLSTTNQTEYKALGGFDTLNWATSTLNMLKAEGKVYSDDTIKVLGLPYGGPHNGKDSEGEYFSEYSNFFEGYNEYPPVMYVHGTKNGFEPEIIGETVDRWYDDRGGWFAVKLNKDSTRYDQIMDAYAGGYLKASTGPVPASVSIDTDGHIDSWLVGELSLVDTRAGFVPVNQYAITKATDDVLFEDYYGDPVYEVNMWDEFMRLFAKMASMMNDDSFKSKMAETMGDEKCLECGGGDPVKEPLKMPEEIKAEIAKCERCPEVHNTIREFFKAGKIKAIDAYNALDRFVDTTEGFDEWVKSLEPAKAESLGIAGGQSVNVDDINAPVDKEHMERQYRLVGLKK